MSHGLFGGGGGGGGHPITVILIVSSVETLYCDQRIDEWLLKLSLLCPFSCW